MFLVHEIENIMHRYSDLCITYLYDVTTYFYVSGKEENENIN